MDAREVLSGEKKIQKRISHYVVIGFLMVFIYQLVKILYKYVWM